MKTILLVIALVAKADAPKAGLQEAAVASAAVASEAVLPTGSFVKPSEPVAGELSGATPSEEARANAPVVDAALPSETAKTPASVTFDDIRLSRSRWHNRQGFCRSREPIPTATSPTSTADGSCRDRGA